MSKLYKLREWLTVPEAAKQLSLSFGEEVAEADVLRLALDGHLKLSVNFINKTIATKGTIVPLRNAKVVPGIPIGDAEPYFVVLGYHLNENEVVDFDDDYIYLTGVWDLCMLENERLNVEAVYYKSIGGPSLDKWSLEGALVTNADGCIYRLSEEMEKPTKEFFDRQSELLLKGLMTRIAQDNVAKDEAERLIAEHHERRKEIWEDKSPNYFPASGLPKDSLFVVRTNALREFEQSIDGASAAVEKPITTTERNTMLTIVAALCDYSAIKIEERGAAGQIAKLTEEIGAAVSDDTIRRWLKMIPDALAARMK